MSHLVAVQEFLHASTAAKPHPPLRGSAGGGDDHGCWHGEYLRRSHPGLIWTSAVFWKVRRDRPTELR